MELVEVGSGVFVFFSPFFFNTTIFVVFVVFFLFVSLFLRFCPLVVGCVICFLVQFFFWGASGVCFHLIWECFFWSFGLGVSWEGFSFWQVSLVCTLVCSDCISFWGAESVFFRALGVCDSG